MAITPPPFPKEGPDTETVKDVPYSTGDRVLSGIGGFLSGATSSGGSDRGTSFRDSSLGKAIGEHHDRQIAEAQMHQGNVAKAGAALAQIQQGINPETGQKFDPNNPQDQVEMERQRQFYESQYQTAHELFVKSAGVHKDVKGALQKGKMLLDHFLGIGQPPQSAQGGGKGGAAPAAGGSGPTPPPGGTQPSPTNPDTRTIGQIASQETPTPAEPYDERSRARLSRTAEQMSYDKAAGRWKDQEKYLHDLKMEEVEATSKARAATRAGTVPRPMNVRPISVRDAKNMRDAMGSEFLDAQGNVLDLDKYPETMSFEGSYVAFTDPETMQREWKVVWTPFSPNQKISEVAGMQSATNPADVSKPEARAAGTIGPKPYPTITATTSPETGQTTVSKKTPVVGGAPMRGGGAGTTSTAPSAQSVPRGTSQRAPMTPPPGPGEGPAKHPSKGTASVLAEDGIHINEKAVGQKWQGGVLTSQVIEAANQLIDDRDVDKIPSKVRELGAALAREKAGWWQGKFTPAEEMRLDEAENFITALKQDEKALKVLDSGAWNRYWVGKAKEPHKEGTGILGAPAADFENFMRTRAATRLTNDESRFSYKFDQASQIVAGLGQLVRSGRATNAQVDLIRRELPNIFSSKDSKEAKARLDNLLKEVSIARRTGTQRRGQERTGMTPPPPTAGKATKSLDDEIMGAIGVAKGTR